MSMNKQALLKLVEGQVATMFAVVSVAGKVVEGLVAKGCISAADGQAVLTGIAEELRDDGDGENGKCAEPAYRIASELEERAFALGPGK
ncbi:hypothetical protein [Bradyrhizobium sp. 18]|uniref:hypothetical protein n=1 Tax=Bradyrhizobium sp. 18 TaxID=2782657 RepID=UPI001FFB51CD|nr:hypothetical protein [Bradyrhizobium sp. 18]MCK1507188.1 hypothetical protein [Bradyrhizobium sp. 18]